MTRTLLIALGVAVALTLPAEAAKKRAASTGDGTYPASQMADLTAAECNKAQGAVVTDNSCASGAACVKDGANGPGKICLSFSQ